ncbi:MAG: NAD(P) transhydrogenase subunit alpha [Alphaproteobacteria bacterium]|nr:NAD(P) transhydrogenase subunit alpha [Alphaproteobacteria bacterium]
MHAAGLIDPFVFRVSIFVLAIFVGYFVVWSVSPALHTPLMSVTNAISSVIVVGALIAVGVSTHPAAQVVVPIGVHHHVIIAPGEAGTIAAHVTRTLFGLAPVSSGYSWASKLLGFFALILASVNIFGGFLVTQRMLAMYKKKEK